MLHRGICCGNSEYLLWYTRGTHLPSGPAIAVERNSSRLLDYQAFHILRRAHACGRGDICGHVLSAVYGAHDFTYRRSLAASCGIPTETGMLLRGLFPNNASGLEACRAALSMVV